MINNWFLWLILLISSCTCWKDYQLKGLEAHNALREHHGVPPMVLTTALCMKADICAKYYGEIVGRIDHGCPLFYGSIERPGENLYWWGGIYSTEVKLARVGTFGWYSEIKAWDFEKNRGRALHFTQVLWKTSTKLGIGMYKMPKGNTYMVALYSLPGNYAGMYKQSVPPPLPGHTTRKVNDEPDPSANGESSDPNDSNN